MGLTVVSTILMPILSGSVVLVQRRSDDDPFVNTDYDTNSVTNDNIDLAGGYYNGYNYNTDNTEEDNPYNTNNNYYDPYYGYNNNYNYNYDNTAEGRLLTFGHPEFYFGDWKSWFNNAKETLARTSDSTQSLDWVDSTFGLMNIESQVCRERAICELERKASEKAFFGFIVKNLNSYVNGLDKYERAID